MEGEKILMAAGVTAAVVTAAFVFWGPSGLYSTPIRLTITTFSVGTI